MDELGKMDKIRAELRAIRRLLSGAERTNPNQRDIFLRIGKHIDEIEKNLYSSEPRIKKRTGESTKYSIERINGQPLLSELRPNARALRVTREVFDAIISILARSNRALSIDEIISEITEELPSVPADWQVRVAVRFMLRADPTFLERSRSRYRAKLPKQIKALAGRWWNNFIAA